MGHQNVGKEFNSIFWGKVQISAVQTPGFSPPAPAPAKKTPAPGKKLRLREKNSGSSRKHVKIEI